MGKRKYSSPQTCFDTFEEDKDYVTCMIYDKYVHPMAYPEYFSLAFSTVFDGHATGCTSTKSKICLNVCNTYDRFETNILKLSQ
jgi:hypothetical protein